MSERLSGDIQLTNVKRATMYCEREAMTRKKAVFASVPSGIWKQWPAELLGICTAIMSENATWVP